MRYRLLAIILTTLLPYVASADSEKRVYSWVDEDGVTHYGDSIPAQYAELPKTVLNEHAVKVDELEGKKTPEQIEAERIAAEIRVAEELRRRQDQALLATYLSVDEILMHRDRRVELFQAQSRVTELYLRNLERRLAKLHTEASRFQPYSDDPEAPMIDDDLAEDIRLTKETINKHEANLDRFRTDEEQIIARFDGDINRFKALKGIE
ncbi:MAG: DUF4124 domain-containing protein [Woeseiaceae bacterium]|nr:DUF4124 domain-containing protein [Woeseiaceae bacterium]